MTDYSKYQLEDFLTDEQFVKWVIHPDPNRQLFWEKWIENHPHKEDLVNEAAFVIKNIHFKVNKNEPQQSDLILNNILQQKYSKKQRSNDNFTYKTIYLKIAAAILLLITAFISFQYVNQSTSLQELNVAKVTFLTKENPNGQKSTFILPDGTKVKLNAASIITYPEQFSDSIRNVKLTGEAYFDVSDDPEKPFNVNTEELNVTALGTSFNVKAFSDDESVKVALITGKVLVQDSDNNSSVLVPGEKADFSKERNIIKVSKFDFDQEIGWKDNIIVFKKADFTTFVKEIERWYGVNILTEGQPDHQWRINGKFEDLSLELLLESVKFSKDINYKMNGKSVTINF